MSARYSTPVDAPEAGARTVPKAKPQGYEDYGEPSGYGWMIFAGTAILIAGTLNLIYGIAGVAKSSFYVANTHFVFAELKTWSWILLFIGVIEICVGVAVYARSSWGRWAGVAVASLSAIAQLLSIAAYPWLAVAIFALDMLVIYGLLVHGGQADF